MLRRNWFTHKSVLGHRSILGAIMTHWGSIKHDALIGDHHESRCVICVELKQLLKQKQSMSRVDFRAWDCIFEQVIDRAPERGIKKRQLIENIVTEKSKQQ